MTLAVIIPVKGFVAGKSRLSTILSDAERAAVNRAFLDHTFDVLAQFPRAGMRIVVSADDEVLAVARARGAVAAPERSPGLNAALGDAVARADAQQATDILVLSIDLPRLASDDLEALVAGGIAIAPDQSGRGTNAIFLPVGVRIAFAYGESSFAAHVASARSLGHEVRVVRRPGLAFDVDTPDDYREWREIKGGTG
jgi:2-phospho-L-lactate/phosphoenolpyruvate guanylyltransferase